MQTETTKETAPASKKEEPKKEETRAEIKVRLLAIKDHKRTKKESLQLVAIAEEEAAEKTHGALIHRLTERADKWGRKQIATITREVTDEVAKIGPEESARMLSQHTSHRAKIADARAWAKAEMARIQSDLTTRVQNIDAEAIVAEEAIRAEFKPRYDQASWDIKDRSNDVTNTVGDFTQVLATLTTEQLEELQNDGTTQVGDDCIAVPDAAPRPAAV